MDNTDFHTFGEYMKKDGNLLTASMEDYLEMIYRLSIGTGFVRIHELSEALNVQPPSASRMVHRLKELQYLKYEKYGYIMLEVSGLVAGKALLERHEKIETLLRILGVPDGQLLAETEKMEHTLNRETLACIERFIIFVNEHPTLVEQLHNFKPAL